MNELIFFLFNFFFSNYLPVSSSESTSLRTKAATVWAAGKPQAHTCKAEPRLRSFSGGQDSPTRATHQAHKQTHLEQIELQIRRSVWRRKFHEKFEFLHKNKQRSGKNDIGNISWKKILTYLIIQQKYSVQAQKKAYFEQLINLKGTIAGSSFLLALQIKL